MITAYAVITPGVELPALLRDRARAEDYAAIVRGTVHTLVDEAAILRKFDAYVPADQASSMRYRIAELEAQVEALQEELGRQVLPAVGRRLAGPLLADAEVITDPAMIQSAFEADAAVDRGMADLLDDQCDGWAGMPQRTELLS